MHCNLHGTSSKGTGIQRERVPVMRGVSSMRQEHANAFGRKQENAFRRERGPPGNLICQEWTGTENRLYGTDANGM